MLQLSQIGMKKYTGRIFDNALFLNRQRYIIRVKVKSLITKLNEFIWWLNNLIKEN